MVGSDLVIPLGSTRAKTIIGLFNVERTRFLLEKRKKYTGQATTVLDKLIEWDAAQDPPANTHQLSQQYNKILDEV